MRIWEQQVFFSILIFLSSWNFIFIELTMKNKFYNCYMHEQILYAMIWSKLTEFESCLTQFIWIWYMRISWPATYCIGEELRLRWVWACTYPHQHRNSSHSQYEPRHEISNNVVCATSKASDQPAHTRSLVRAFTSRLGILWLLSLKRGYTGWSEFTLVKMPHCWKSHVATHIWK